MPRSQRRCTRVWSGAHTYEQALHTAESWVPDNADEATREQFAFLCGGVTHQLGGTLLGLRPVASDAFDENRAGPDHVASTVASKQVLDDAVTQLDDRGIAHAGVKDIGFGHILEFRDPDNTALELIAPKG